MKYQEVVAAARKALSPDEFVLWQCEVDAAVFEVMETIEKLGSDQQAAVLLRCAELFVGPGNIGEER